MSKAVSDASPSLTPAQKKVQIAAQSVFEHSRCAPEIGVVLGSGLGAWAEGLKGAQDIPYASIPEMPVSGVAGHSGRLWLGTAGGKQVACLQGRVHAYEGHSIERVVFGVRLLAALGCKRVLLTNAAGGIRADLPAGSLMLLRDHLNLTGRNPLIDWPLPQGPFVDMSSTYDPTLGAAAVKTAKGLGLALHEGVYAAVLGPSYETPAEVRMLRTLGADAVGMSTAVEAIALRAAGVQVGAISCITNAAAGISAAPLNHEDVQSTAAQVAQSFQSLLSGWIAAL